MSKRRLSTSNNKKPWIPWNTRRILITHFICTAFLLVASRGTISRLAIVRAWTEAHLCAYDLHYDGKVETRMEALQFYDRGERAPPFEDVGTLPRGSQVMGLCAREMASEVWLQVFWVDHWEIHARNRYDMQS